MSDCSVFCLYVRSVCLEIAVACVNERLQISAVRTSRCCVCSVWTNSTVADTMHFCSPFQVCPWFVGYCHQSFWNRQQLQQWECSVVEKMTRLAKLDVDSTITILQAAWLRELSSFGLGRLESGVAFTDCRLSRDGAWRVSFFSDADFLSPVVSDALSDWLS